MSEDTVKVQPGQESAAPSLPDLNAEKPYRFEHIQNLLDEAACFNLFSRQNPRHSNIAVNNGGGIIGFRIHEVLHRFDISVRPPTADAGVRAGNVLGEALGSFEHRWMIIPDGFGALPKREPPPTLLDPTRSQRFVMLDSVCSFNGGSDGFRGFGTGNTFPVTVNGQSQLHAAAVGSITEGFGKFAGREGTYTYCGNLSSNEGFSGNFLCRVPDPEAQFFTENSLPTLHAWPSPEPGITYLILRGQKKDASQKTTYNFGPGGQVIGINVVQQLKVVNYDAVNRERGGLRATRNIGPVIGGMHARILFNFFNPEAPGTALAPIPFQSYNEYTFTDPEGRTVARVGADGKEGRTFRLKLPGAPGQAALRFGGFGPIMNGTGCFERAQGLMADNSVVAVSPSAISTLYVLRLLDPDGRYRTPFVSSSDSCQRNRERLIDACRS